MKIHAVIFDLGGVLVRTEDRNPRRDYAQRLGLTYEELDALVFGSTTAVRAALGEISADEHWNQLCLDLQLPPEESPGFQEAFWGGDRLDAALVDYIRSLRPRIRTALLSNAWSTLRDYLVGRWQIVDAFDEIVISAEVGLVKPDPRIYQLAVERLGVAPGEAVFVDDFPENVEGARDAGLHAIQFRSTQQVIGELERLLSQPE